MGILDKFKRKSGAKHVLLKKPDKKSDNIRIGKKPIKKFAPSLKISTSEYAKIYKIIKSHHIHESAGDLAKENKYVFKIWKNANKIQVKRVVEKLYNVQIKKINIINVPRKRRRLGKVEGWRPGYKKAVVSLSKGKIEIG